MNILSLMCKTSFIWYHRANKDKEHLEGKLRTALRSNLEKPVVAQQAATYTAAHPPSSGPQLHDMQALKKKNHDLQDEVGFVWSLCFHVLIQNFIEVVNVMRSRTLSHRTNIRFYEDHLGHHFFILHFTAGKRNISE